MTVRLARGAVRYHSPRDRSPVAAVLVGTLVLVTLVSAQLSLAGDVTRSTPLSAAAAQEATPAASDVAAPERTALATVTAPSSAAPDAAALPQPVEVTFPVGSDSPTGDVGALLGPVVEALLADPTTRVRVVGHAEVSQDPVLEEQLSLRRAGTVQQLLVERGVPDVRTDVVGAGATETGRSVSGTDRRVVVEVVSG